jgi:predicted DCC family thiol-disulfide oxidoreductase YuxK
LARIVTASPSPRIDDEAHALLLFDGVCTLCNQFVNAVLDADSSGYFLLGALQSEEARPYLEAFGVDPDALDSVVLIEKGRLYTHSTAALRVCRRLDAPWPLLSVFLAVPRPVRDVVYDIIAEHRYDWFGTRDECRLPTPDVRARFLEDPA